MLSRKQQKKYAPYYWLIMLFIIIVEALVVANLDINECKVQCFTKGIVIVAANIYFMWYIYVIVFPSQAIELPFGVGEEE